MPCIKLWFRIRIHPRSHAFVSRPCIPPSPSQKEKAHEDNEQYAEHGSCNRARNPRLRTCRWWTEIGIGSGCRARHLSCRRFRPRLHLWITSYRCEARCWACGLIIVHDKGSVHAKQLCRQPNNRSRIFEIAIPIPTCHGCLEAHAHTGRTPARAGIYTLGHGRSVQFPGVIPWVVLAAVLLELYPLRSDSWIQFIAIAYDVCRQRDCDVYVWILSWRRDSAFHPAVFFRFGGAECNAQTWGAVGSAASRTIGDIRRSVKRQYVVAWEIKSAEYLVDRVGANSYTIAVGTWRAVASGSSED